MIAPGVWARFADFLTNSRQLFRVVFPMRQSLRIRVEFVPSRLSTQYLRSAYDLVAPIVRRAVVERAAERCATSSARSTKRARVCK